MFVFPTEQRVLTGAEYTALGYIEIGAVPDRKADAEIKPSITPAYRSDSKEDYYIDLGMGIVKIGYTASTGGLVAASRTTLGYVTSLLA